MAACNNAHEGENGELVGDPTETAMLATARALGADGDRDGRAARPSSTSTPP